MKDIVSFETALRLKEAGFPQPSLEVGQFWHSQYFGAYWLCVVTKQATKPFTYLCPLDVIEWGHQFGHPGTPEDTGSPIFAPTATDILRELWFRFSLKFGGNGKWIVLQTKDLNDREDQITTDPNPAEAAAQAWLIDNEK